MRHWLLKEMNCYYSVRILFMAIIICGLITGALCFIGWQTDSTKPTKTLSSRPCKFLEPLEPSEDHAIWLGRNPNNPYNKIPVTIISGDTDLERLYHTMKVLSTGIDYIYVEKNRVLGVCMSCAIRITVYYEEPADVYKYYFGKNKEGEYNTVPLSVFVDRFGKHKIEKADKSFIKKWLTIDPKVEIDKLHCVQIETENNDIESVPPAPIYSPVYKDDDDFSVRLLALIMPV